MADGISVKITGPDLGVKVLELNARIEANLEEGLDFIADETQSAAKDNCPVRTGDLRDDIKVYATKLQRDIGNNIYYCLYVHQGTYKQKANPYLFNGFETTRGKLIPYLQSLGVQ